MKNKNKKMSLLPSSQECHECCTNTGTVILDIEGAADASTIKDERERIIKAINEEDEIALRQAILTAGNLASLQVLVRRATTEANRLAEIRRAECEKKGKAFKPIYVSGKVKSNTSKRIFIPDVVNPYSVMDDMSYRISKFTKQQRRKYIMDEAAREASVLGEEFEADVEVRRKIMYLI